jgi:biotin carboxyl carrier protein
MRYEAQINGRHSLIEVDERDGRTLARVDGRSYDIQVARPEGGTYLIFADTRVYETRVWSGDSKTFDVDIGGHLFAVQLIDPRRRRVAADHSDTGQQYLKAPMPGKVVRILLGPGDEVAAGQGVVVVEAMKMQNEVKSTRPGRVSEIRVAEGDTVNGNQILAVIE